MAAGKLNILNSNITPIEHWHLLNTEVNSVHSFLLEYYKLCRSGEKLIGCELATMLEMLIQDMQSEQYKFNLETPHKRIAFIEKNIKHFESPFAGKPFILTLEQKAITEAIFGFQIYDTEYNEWVRRFKEVLLLVARKNGKTPFVAALVLSEWFCGESGQKVMCASNDYEQASIVFDCINNFREESSPIEKVTRKNNLGIFFGNYKQRRKRGKFSKQNKGTIKKMSANTGAKEGRNLKLVIVDEVHEMKDRSTIMPLRSSLTTQKEPLFFEITTEGIVRDGYLDERLQEVRKVIRGELDRPRLLAWLYTQDSETEVWNDEQTWVKSNPHLGIIKKWSELRDLVENAKLSSSQRAFTLAKEFNIRQNSAAAWLEEKIIINEQTFKLEEFKNCWCIAFADLSETNDLAAITLMFIKPGSNIKYFHTMYFVTSVKAGDGQSTDSPTNPEKKDYNTWAAAGLCRIVPGSIIDDNVVADYLWELFQAYGIRPYKCGYDNWHAKEFAKITAKHFGENVLVKMPMDFNALNNPMRTLEEDLRAHLVNYQNNEICRWNFRNTAVQHNNIGWIRPIKIQGYIGNKIDGTLTKIGCYATLRQCKQEFLTKIGA